MVSLQDIQAQSRPPESPYLRHLLRKFARGMLSVSDGRDLAALRRGGYVKGEKLTMRGRLAAASLLEEDGRNAQEKKSQQGG